MFFFNQGSSFTDRAQHMDWYFLAFDVTGFVPKAARRWQHLTNCASSSCWNSLWIKRARWLCCELLNRKWKILHHKINYILKLSFIKDAVVMMGFIHIVKKLVISPPSHFYASKANSFVFLLPNLYFLLMYFNSPCGSSEQRAPHT